MAKGYVMTSRGSNLNMDELIDNASRPIGGTEQPGSTRETASYSAASKIAPVLSNVRGFVPTGTNRGPKRPDEPTRAINTGSNTDTENKTKNKIKNPQTLAEITGVKVDKPKVTKQTAAENSMVDEDEGDEVLGDLVKNLKKS